MTAAPHQLSAQAASLNEVPVHTLARRLAAAGMGVEVSHHQGTWEFTIRGVESGKSFVALATNGQARWYYEPAPGPTAGPAALTAIITYLLGAPQGISSLAAYRAFPLKGQVGRSLQDQGLAVALRISEDLESFEATTDIDITSPARPWLGTVTLSDDAAVDWRCNWRAAFGGNAAGLIDVITPILRADYARR
jgi:hypothetical protein